MTIIQVMQTTSLANIRAKLSSFVDSVQATHERVIITRNGEPAAVLMAADDLESLEETIAVLSDPEAMAELGEAKAAMLRGDLVGLSEIRMRTPK
jgi:antitoxin YefM